MLVVFETYSVSAYEQNKKLFHLIHQQKNTKRKRILEDIYRFRFCSFCRVCGSSRSSVINSLSVLAFATPSTVIGCSYRGSAYHNRSMAHFTSVVSCFLGTKLISAKQTHNLRTVLHLTETLLLKIYFFAF